MTEHWAESIAGLREQLGAKHLARETGLQTCRKIVQTSSKSIRHIHRREFDDARALLAQANEMVAAAHELLSPHPDLFFAGYLQDAEKEFVEAAAVFAIALGNALPRPEELGVYVTSYLNGMAEAASECRRYVLDTLRKGDAARAEQILEGMEDIYDELISIDFPDALTGGLRRTCDALRAVLERTRSDFAITSTQKELQRALEANVTKLRDENL